MADVQTVSVAIASASIVVASLYYVTQIRHQTRTRDTELITRLYAKFIAKEFQQEFQKIMKDLNRFVLF